MRKAESTGKKRKPIERKGEVKKQFGIWKEVIFKQK